MENEFILEIWPNPTSDIISMNILSRGSEPLDLKLVDMTGRILLEERIGAAEANIIRELSLASYAKGVYFLSLQSNGYTEMQKIIKQ
jgi:hypothetical protein